MRRVQAIDASTACPSIPGMSFSQRVSRLAPALLLWAGMAACAVGLVVHRMWEALPFPRFFEHVLLALLVAVFPILIVLVQNDTGTVLIMCTVVVTMVAVSGARTRWVAGLLVGGATAAVVAWQVGLVKDYQIARLTSFVNPEEAASTAAYNATQARIAIGGGGLWGRGLVQGPQTQGNFVPVNESDFIFTVVGEELGFVGSAGLLLLFGVLIWRAMRIAMRAEDLFGTLMATGIDAVSASAVRMSLALAAHGLLLASGWPGARAKQPLRVRDALLTFLSAAVAMLGLKAAKRRTACWPSISSTPWACW